MADSHSTVPEIDAELSPELAQVSFDPAPGIRDSVAATWSEEEGKAKDRFFLKTAGLEVLKLNDSELYEKCCGSEEAVDASLCLLDGMQGLRLYLESALACVQSIETRLLVVLNRRWFKEGSREA